MKSVFFQKVPLVLLLAGFNLKNLLVVETKLVEYFFNVTYDYAHPDGVRKKTFLINNQFPGPLVEATVGDELRITVLNLVKTREGISIHWHGIHQNGSISQDGPSWITQCPLRYGMKQTYQFFVYQSGTFWYHSHLTTQYSEGLWGVMVIHNYPPKATTSRMYDEQFTLALSDWYHQDGKLNEAWYLSPGFHAPPFPNSILINGKGRYECSIARRQRLACDASKQFRQVFKVLPNKKYRVRVVNTGSLLSFNFSIDGHQLRAIEVDGTDIHESLPRNIVKISPGQRYSFLLETTSGRHGSRFLFRSSFVPDSQMHYRNINSNPQVTITEVTAVLQYDENIVQNLETKFEPFDYLQSIPRQFWPPTDFLKEEELLPRQWTSVPKVPDYKITLYSSVGKSRVKGSQRMCFNHTPFELPSDKPILLKVLDNEPLPINGYPYVKIPFNSVIEVVVNNFVADHPLHLHGHSFHVVGKGPMRTDRQGNHIPYDERFDGAKYQPVVPTRDTVFVPRGHWLVIRFLADNPGVWAFHCHVDWHSFGGMGFVFIEGEEIFRRDFQIAKETKQMCNFV